MTNDELLRQATSVYVIDWPTRDIPDSLARSGIRTFVHGGPRPDQVDVFEVGDDGEVAIVERGTAPDHADFVYTFRPLADLPQVIEMATAVGASTIWNHDPSEEARRLVEASGLTYVDGPDLADEVRRVRG